MPTVTRSEETQTIEMSQRSRRSAGEDAVPVPSHSTRHVPDDVRTINGWGADLDPKNRPMVPMELPSNVEHVRGHVEAWQQPNQKIHVSNEHPNLTPVFGETGASGGVSGMLRDYAYEYGEATNRHWMTLLLADRIEMIGSIFLDALRGRPDNFIREKGWTVASEGRSRTRNATIATAVGLALAGALLAVSSKRR